MYGSLSGKLQLHPDHGTASVVPYIITVFQDVVKIREEREVDIAMFISPVM